MKLDFSLYNIIILLGGIQGVILSIVLVFSKKEHQKANRFLALLVLIMALTNLDLFRNDTKLDELYELPFSIPYLWLGIGPALYFYTRYLTKPTYRFTKKKGLHFLPLAIECTYYLSSELWAVDKENLKFHFWVAIPLETYLSMLSIAIYIVMSYRILKDYQDKAKEKEFKLAKQLRLLRRLILSIAIILALWFIINLRFDYYYRILDLPINESDLIAFFPVLLALTLVIYIIGFSGYYRGEQVLIINNTVPQKEKAPQKPVIDMSKEEMLGYINSIKQAMQEEKLYLNPDLSLTMLADRIEINPKYLSYILNSGMNKKFNDLVNEYRVEEVKKRLLDSENENLTIIGIAMDSGFNSKSAFNRIFKEFTNMSPKEYKDNHTAKQ